jgi:hypothetical protein
LRLAEALKILNAEGKPAGPAVDVLLATGFSTLHLKTFLRAHVQRLEPQRKFAVREGLYGDLAGTLERALTAEPDYLVAVVEWPDVDPRLALRSRGSWDPQDHADILASAVARLRRLQSLLSRFNCPAVVCPPSIAFPPMAIQPSWQCGPLEAALGAALADFIAGVASTSRIVSAGWLSLASPLRERYDAKSDMAAGFPYSLAHAASDAGWRQLHVAETEKYAHVTYFFNGGREAPLPGEDRLLVPSPKVATYDLQPAMSAPGVADKLVEAIGSNDYDLIVANFANADMVGHTGVWEATVEGLATVDASLARIVDAVSTVAADDDGGPGALLVITADHGNADVMRDADGRPVTAHSLSPVPVLFVGRAAEGRSLHNGVLADVAPTICELTGLPRWDGMTGSSLLEPAGQADA